MKRSNSRLWRPFFQVALSCVLLMTIASTSWGLGEESEGNAPINGANYTDWPGILPVINNKARVYRVWVNGNEFFYFKGDAAALNKALQHFAESGGKLHEVLLRPGTGKASTFKSAAIQYDWHLHIVGGIARSMSRTKGGSLIWPNRPTMTVYVGQRIKLEQLKVPDGITLIELKDLKARYTEALKDESQNVRGWGCGHLARLDPFDTESVKTITAMLKDKSAWVRLNAAGALAHFGKTAASAVPTLKELAKTENDKMKNRIAKTLTAIEQGADRTKEAAAHKKALGTITKFRKAAE